MSSFVPITSHPDDPPSSEAVIVAENALYHELAKEPTKAAPWSDLMISIRRAQHETTIQATLGERAEMTTVWAWMQANRLTLRDLQETHTHPSLFHHQALTKLTLEQIIAVWSMFEEAYFGQASYAGDVAEIYLSSLLPNPRDETTTANLVENHYAACALRELMLLFERERQCRITVNDRSIADWCLQPGRLRHHVRVHHDGPCKHCGALPSSEPR